MSNPKMTAGLKDNRLTLWSGFLKPWTQVGPAGLGHSGAGSGNTGAAPSCSDWQTLRGWGVQGARHPHQSKLWPPPTTHSKFPKMPWGRLLFHSLTAGHGWPCGLGNKGPRWWPEDLPREGRSWGRSSSGRWEVLAGWGQLGRLLLLPSALLELGWGGAERSAGTSAGCPSPRNPLTWRNSLRSCLWWWNAVFLSGYCCKPRKTSKMPNRQKASCPKQPLWSRASTCSEHCQEQEQPGSGAPALQRHPGTGTSQLPCNARSCRAGSVKDSNKFGAEINMEYNNILCYPRQAFSLNSVLRISSNRFITSISYPDHKLKQRKNSILYEERLKPNLLFVTF